MMAGLISSVVHVTSWLSRQGGGIPPVVWALASETRLQGIDCLVAGLEDQWVEADSSAKKVPLLTGSLLGPGTLGFSPNLLTRLTARMKPAGIIHSHGLWMYPGIVARRVSKSTASPLVISPHGMLEPWALENSRWKKRLAAWLFENKNLRSADCLHALCEAEARNIRSYGLRNPVAVIPNGVDLADFSSLPPYGAIERDNPRLKGKKRMLFLSRIHPKKGLPHLLRAWQKLASQFPDWRLLIAGNDQLGHEAELKKLTSELGLLTSVIFLGPLYGETKKQALAGADIFVLPSFSEGFSMAVLEAAACGLPVLLTPQCNFPELAAAGGAVEVQPEVESCENGLRHLLSLSQDERRGMGLRGRELIQKAYTWPGIAARMISVYAWLLRQGPKPDCVYVD
jgi:poly(glycerol-phosphate) alpha-glucosyltransferase